MFNGTSLTKQVEKLVIMISLLIVTFFTIVSVQAADSPYQVSKVVADQLFGRLKKEQLVIRKNPEHLRTIVQKELIPYIDVRYAGALVLGSSFRDTTAAQKTAYFNAFESYLAQVYGQALSLYNGQHYEFSAENVANMTDIVPIRIIIIETGGRPPIRLDFQWRKNSKTAEWKAYDMSVEGVSMIATKQNEWATILRQGGVDALTSVLKKAAAQKITLEQKN